MFCLIFLQHKKHFISNPLYFFFTQFIFPFHFNLFLLIIDFHDGYDTFNFNNIAYFDFYAVWIAHL